MAKEFGIAHFARLPIDPAIAAMVDAGEVESVPTEPLAGLADYLEEGEKE